MATIESVQTANWQISNDLYGNVVEGADSISQSIINVIATRRGSDPFRPTFGSNVWEYIDQPINVAAPGIIRAIREAVDLWVDGAVIVGITHEYQDSFGNTDGIPSGIRFDIAWSPTFVGDASGLAMLTPSISGSPAADARIIRILATEQGPGLLTEGGQFIALT